MVKTRALFCIAPDLMPSNTVIVITFRGIRNKLIMVDLPASVSAELIVFLSVCSPVRLGNMKTPEGGHGREVETQPQLEAYEGQEGDLPHEGTVLGPVSSQGCGQVARQDQPDCPAEELCRPSAALLEQEGAQHDGHHEGGEYFTQGKIFLAETLT